MEHVTKSLILKHERLTLKESTCDTVHSCSSSLYCHCLLTTWFWAQMDTTPLEMEAIIGRTGCHCTKSKDEMGKLSDCKEHGDQYNWKYIDRSLVSMFILYTVFYWARIWVLTSLQQHPAAALLWFHAGSSPGCRYSSPRCRGHAAWLNQPRCTRHRRRNSSASTESWTQKTGGGHENQRKGQMQCYKMHFPASVKPQKLWFQALKFSQSLRYLKELVSFTPTLVKLGECLPILPLQFPT